ncbi:DNA/RNA non-specific endonuclease [Salininema proteolyticum]|uniref:DNA/RNA non-specific endonuclease n=1 Tax=Salininema proteolyticum TaxID=1607685 RepID=A0ABV8U2G1_9ACTN
MAITPYSDNPAFPPQRRRFNAVIAAWIAAGLTAVLVVTLAFIVLRDGLGNDIGVIDADPAGPFNRAPAVTFSYDYRARDGVTTSGWFTVTSDGHATGEIADYYAGRATYQATPDDAAVWGSEAWWARRHPELTSRTAGRWVKIDEGTAFPVDVRKEFTPLAISGLIRDIDENGAVLADYTERDGMPVIAKTYEDWTLVVSDAIPSTVVSLSGPLNPKRFTTARTSEGPAIVTADLNGDSEVRQAQDTMTRPYPLIEIIPQPSAKETAEIVDKGTTDTVSGKDSRAKPYAAPATSKQSEPQPPENLEKIVVPQPRLNGTINSSSCTTPTCSWSFTISNSGTGPATVTGYASATPGMGTVPVTIGTLAPGDTKSSSEITFPNPAPPGKTVTIDLQVIFYAPQIQGPDPDTYNKVAEKLPDDRSRGRFNDTLSRSPKPYKPLLIDTVDRLIEEGNSAAEALDSAERLVEANPSQGVYSPLPQHKRLFEAGKRFRGWDVLPGLTVPEVVPLYQESMNTVISELGRTAEPNVSLTTHTDSSGRPVATEVVSDTGSPEQSRCYLITGDGSMDIEHAVDEAIKDFTSDGSCQRHAVIIPDSPLTSVDQTGPSPNSQRDRTRLDDRIRGHRDKSRACTNGDANLSRLTVVTSSNRYEWAGQELCMVNASRTTKEQLDKINQLIPDSTIWTDLINAGVVKVDPTSKQLTEIKWRDKDEKCRPSYEEVEVKNKTPGSDDTRKSGYRALGAAAYLCDPPRKGETATKTPWDWPKSNAVTGKNQEIFARCHLVARQLGGRNITDNLVTCLQMPMNSPVMSGFEGDIRKLVKETDVLYISIPVYKGPAAPRREKSLSAIHVIAIAKNGTFLNRCFINRIIADTPARGDRC